MKKLIIYLLAAAVMVGLMGCSSPPHRSGKTGDIEQTLSACNWSERVGDQTGIVISIARQELMLIKAGKMIKCYRCSTAKAGAGNVQGSGQTPMGWHRIAEKIGDGLPSGAILKDRQWTGQICPRGLETGSDLILSRILWLEGLEAGVNRGSQVDSKNRYIYIHGTNQIGDLGKLASGGCIRLDPEEMIDLYRRVDKNCFVLITQN